MEGTKSIVLMTHMSADKLKKTVYFQIHHLLLVDSCVVNSLAVKPERQLIPYGEVLADINTLLRQNQQWNDAKIAGH